MSIKTAIIGYGGMGSFHASQIKKIDSLQVVGAYDIKAERVKKAMDDGYKGYNSLEECLSDDIELVIIATQNNFHKELAIKAMKAGKHVICEKPVMMNAKELEDVIKVANEENKLFTVHQNRRWDRDYRIVKEALSKKLIGQPFYIESRVQGSKGVPGDWRCVKDAGGGMLLDWGVHLLDQILWMVDSPVTEIYAHLLSVKFKDVDDNFKVLLKFENNLSALIEVDTYTFIPLPRWHVSTDEGTLVIDDWDCNGKILKANQVEFKWEESIVYTSAGPTKTMAPRPIETIDEIPLPDMNPDCKDYYDNAAKAIRGEEKQIVTHEQMMRVMKILDAIFKSSENGECIKGAF